MRKDVRSSPRDGALELNDRKHGVTTYIHLQALVQVELCSLTSRRYVRGDGTLGEGIADAPTLT